MIILESILTTFEVSTIFEAAEAVVEISLSLQITNCNQVKLARILDMHCTKVFCAAFLYLQFVFVIFWPKENSKKAVCKMLMKLSTGRVTMAMTTLLTLAAMFGAVRYVVCSSWLQCILELSCTC